MNIERNNPIDIIEKAEKARQNDEISKAAELASSGLKLFHRLTPLYLPHPETHNAVILACLARIHVDSHKTMANGSMRPNNVLSHLEIAAGTISTIYNDPEILSFLKGVEIDHNKRPHFFIPEMARDEAKTVISASVLYPPQESTSLIEHAESILSYTYSHSKDCPTVPLMGIELQLSRINRGLVPDRYSLIEDFDRLMKYESGNNPHRIATVASWLVVCGERTGDGEIEKRGMTVFSNIINNHNEWGYMLKNERRKHAMKNIRYFLFRILTPLTTSSERRDALQTNLKCR